MFNDLGAARRSLSATLTEIIATERALQANGIEVVDPEEWMQVRDILARIERRMLSRQAVPKSADGGAYAVHLPNGSTRAQAPSSELPMAQL